MRFMHQSFFAPPHSTLLGAIQNDQLRDFPHMKANDVNKFLAKKSATAKGGMKKRRTGICSTRRHAAKTEGDEPTTEGENPTTEGGHEPENNHPFRTSEGVTFVTQDEDVEDEGWNATFADT